MCLLLNEWYSRELPVLQGDRDHQVHRRIRLILTQGHGTIGALSVQAGDDSFREMTEANCS